ncbi:amylo-alpha-1,6-glucosidase [Pseudonocardia phyllosphaerae]|uniref:amylo-alpha-1,6-glucosidase n=1 Tax=Pseudonocardia phyllosphaerae TaxID=3390502 RepID=UPI00397A3304
MARGDSSGGSSTDSDLTDVVGHLGPADAVVGCRRMRTAFRVPPITPEHALLALAHVTELDDVGAAGPLHAATTADDPGLADPELRKFEAVFGRDSLRVEQFIGDHFPLLRRTTIETLARGQGIRHDAAREEEPGKILHEWRDPDDPVARALTTSNGWGWPYFGSVDTTALFVSAAIRYLDDCPDAAEDEVERRDGSRRTLSACVDEAVAWLCRHVDDDPDGLLTYRRINPGGLENQTWRDSPDALSHADGSLPDFDRPVAALDVQAAVYDALRAAAHRTSDDALTERADRLRRSVFDRFWIDGDDGPGFFAAALDHGPDGARRPLRTRTSDMGHLLYSGLLDGADAAPYRDDVVRQLFGPGLLCSAGLRTLHADEVRYWPGGYHTGSSWLWQSLHVADGLRRHGFHALAEELRARCRRVHRVTGLLPEFARGAEDRGVLNDRIVDVWQDADQRENRLEQPPQEVQAWTAAGLYAAGRASADASAPSPFEAAILAQLG